MSANKAGRTSVRQCLFARITLEEKREEIVDNLLRTMEKIINLRT